MDALSSIAEIVEAVLVILGGFSVLARLTPTPKDDKAIAFATKWLVHFFGLTRPSRK